MGIEVQDWKSAQSYAEWLVGGGGREGLRARPQQLIPERCAAHMFVLSFSVAVEVVEWRTSWG
jgi:hypothetical protein